MKVFLILIAPTITLMLLFNVSHAQDADSVHSANVLRPKVKEGYRYIVPLSLITAGGIALLDKDGDEFFFNNTEVREERNENFRNFTTHADNYLQHAPSLATFILNVSGVKGKHDLANQAAIYLKSQVLMVACVYALKKTVGEPRPDSGRRNSFPSGHTAEAFAGAAFLAREYGYRTPWVSIGAYAAATAVGACRVLNNRHWLSDVLVGAGIGMLSTELVFRTHKNHWGRAGHDRAVEVDPFFGYGASGLSLSYRCKVN